MELQQPFNLDNDEFVSSLNGLTGDIDIVAGDNITVDVLGQDIIINSQSGEGFSALTFKQIAFGDASNIMTSDPLLTYDLENEQFKIGTTTTPLDGASGFPDNPAIVAQSVDGYSALTSYNRSRGTSASADLICANDADDGSILGGHYIDMGLNGSIYDQTISGLFTGGANAGYIMVNGGSLNLITQKNHPIIFRTGNYTSDSFIRMTLASNAPTLSLGLNTAIGITGATGIYRILGATSGNVSITTNATATQTIFQSSAGTTIAVMDNNLSTILSGRMQEKHGANVTAAGTLTLGTDGNYFVIPGNTTVNFITTTNWQDGSEITLLFTGKNIITHNAGGVPVGTAPLFLNASANIAPNFDNVRFIMRYDSSLSAWVQITPIAKN